MPGELRFGEAAQKITWKEAARRLKNSLMPNTTYFPWNMKEHLNSMGIEFGADDYLSLILMELFALEGVKPSGRLKGKNFIVDSFQKISEEE